MIEVEKEGEKVSCKYSGKKDPQFHGKKKVLKTTACGLVAFNGRGTSVVPASYVNIEAANYSVFLICEISMLNVGPEIVKPSQSATFPTSLQT